MDRDFIYMGKALELAEIAAEQGEIPVGAVVVHKPSERIIGRGYNFREQGSSPFAHAEIIAIEQAAKFLGGWRLQDCELFVTLEPCPMCAGAVINSRIDRVVFGAADDKAGSCGTLVNLFELAYNHKPEYQKGVRERECGYILSKFFSILRQKNSGV